MVMQRIRMHEVQIPINIDVGTNAARNMDSNARACVSNARGWWFKCSNVWAHIVRGTRVWTRMHEL
jgi:hypothetical protein